MGHKPLTWEQITAVILLACMPFAAMYAWGGNIPDAARRPGLVTFFVMLALFVALLASGWWRTHRPDRRTDLLARIAPLQQIWQTGPMHLSFSSLVGASIVRIIVIVQNTRDGPGQVRVAFRPQLRALRLINGAEIYQSDVVPLECAVPGAGYVIASCDLPIVPVLQPLDLRFWLEAAATASGRTVRFARRQAVTKPVNPAMTILAGVGGAVVVGGGTFLRVVIPPSELDPSAPAPPPSQDEPGWYVLPIEATTVEEEEAALVRSLRELTAFAEPASE